MNTNRDHVEEQQEIQPLEVQQEGAKQQKERSYKNAKQKRVTGNLVIKIIVFFCLVILVGVGAFCGYATIWSVAEDIYTEDLNTQMENAMYWQARDDQYFIYEMCLWGNYENIDEYCRGKNISVSIYDATNQNHPIWSNYEQYYNPMIFSYDGFPEIERVNEVTGRTWKEKIRIVIYVDTEFPHADTYRDTYHNLRMLNDYAELWPGITLGAIILILICFIFLMCSAGHHNDMDNEEPIREGFFHGIYLDVLAAIFFVLMCVITIIMVENSGISSVGEFWLQGIILTAWAMMIATLGTLFCMELAIRIKRRGFLKYSLVYVLFRLGIKILHFLWKGVVRIFSAICKVLQNLPALWISLLAFWGICILEFLGLVVFCDSTEVYILWFLEKLLLLLLVCYLGLTRLRLFQGGNALAEGNLNYHVDTSKMVLGYKVHGEHLNSIGEGMTKAVSERMKSEHLKTELITNVSHDLKTPLTSIINYSELMNRSDTTPEQEREYAEVIHRQSVRLKKLLDDLLEVSKASTGNLSTEFTLCDVKVLLTQVTGEYEHRFKEKELQLMRSEPTESIRIMADSRHMWRILDNLLGNICKYAQPGSRVYLNVERREEKAFIIFKNISEYPLEVEGQELQERFVRGDKSRHKEGNGLGLSIALSLAELQHGNLQILTDGDLFKAILQFPVYED